MPYVTRTNSEQGDVVAITPTNPNVGPLDTATGYLGILQYSDAISQALPGQDQVCEVIARAANKNVKRTGITALVWLSDEGDGNVGVHLNGRPDENDEPDAVISQQEAQVVFNIVPALGAIQKVAVTRVSDCENLTESGLRNLDDAARVAGLGGHAQTQNVVPDRAPIVEDEDEDDFDDWDEDYEDDYEGEGDYGDDYDNPIPDQEVPEGEINEIRDDLRNQVVEDVDELVEVLEKIGEFISNPSEDNAIDDSDLELVSGLSGSIVNNLGAISGINLALHKSGVEEVTQFRPL